MKNNYSLYPGRNREIIDFEEIDIQKPEITIVTAYYNGGKYIDETTKEPLDTTWGTIRYSKDGVHIVPSNPDSYYKK